jgi:hypothetical protein
MPKGVYTRCDVTEFDIAKWCKRKAFDNSYIDEPYYSLHDELVGMKRTYVALCRSHFDWIERPESMWGLDYEEWLKVQNANV